MLDSYNVDLAIVELMKFGKLARKLPAERYTKATVYQEMKGNCPVVCLHTESSQLNLMQQKFQACARTRTQSSRQCHTSAKFIGRAGSVQ